MMAEALEGYIHGRAAPKLLGRDPAEIQRIWTALYDNDAARFGGQGIEVRAISALDVALWDILGQSVGKPIYQLLGGASRDRVPIYNTCGGPAYGRPPYEVHGRAGALEDLYAWNNAPEDLAAELLEDGISAMKIWPFDDIGIRNQGLTINAEELELGLEPVRRIREAVGSRMRIMIEGHGFWRLPAAIKIARALEDYDIEWIEDMLLAHDIGAIGDLHAQTTVPVLASEYLVTRHQYLPVLQQRAADIIMLDPTWTGGITESHKIGGPRGHVRAPGHDARLHGTVHASGRRPSRPRGAERDVPGDGPGLHPHLVQGRRPAFGDDRERQHPATDRARHRDVPAPRRVDAPGRRGRYVGTVSDVLPRQVTRVQGV